MNYNMTARKPILAGTVVFFALAMIILISGRKSAASVKDTKATGAHLYADSIYNQGNLIAGAMQTFDGKGKILTSVIEEGKEYNVAFDVNTGQLSMACAKEGCLHTSKNCIVNVSMLYMQNVKDVVYFVPGDYQSSIWTLSNNEIKSLYKNDEKIYNLRVWDEYIYLTTDTGIYRISHDGSFAKEQLSSTPVKYNDIFLYDGRIYMVLEDEMLYSMNCDGSDLRRLTKEKVMFPNICNDRIYLRSAEYDSEGMWNQSNELFSIDLDGNDRKSLIDEVYMFVVEKDIIYYSSLPDENYISSIYAFNIETKENKEIVEGAASGSLSVFEETPWIIYEKYTADSQIDESKGETGMAHTHLYCIQKNGTNEKQLDYPEMLQ